MVDHDGKQLETAFSNMLTLLFAGRLKKSVSLAGAKVLLGTEEHQRRFGFRGLVGGHLPAWSKRQCTYVRRMVCGLDVSWLVGEGGVVPTAAMQAEVALQRGLLELREGEEVDHDWVEDPANRGRLLRHAVHTTREMEAAMAAWQLDMVPWQQAELISHGLLPRPPRPPTPYAITPTSKCSVRHVFIDTRGLYGMMRDAGMLGVLTEEGVTSLAKFRNGALPDPARPGHYIEGPKDSHVANRWDALLPDPRRQKLASPKHSFAQIVHTDGVALSVIFLRPKPAAPPAEPPRMGRHMGAVNPLAHLDAEWLGVDPGKTNRATVAHEERIAVGTVVSVWQRSLTAGQYYRDSGITRQAQATKKWLAQVKPQLNALSHVSRKPSSLASYRRFADIVLATYDAMWAEVFKPRWANAKFRLYCGKQRVVARFWSKVLVQSQASQASQARSGANDAAENLQRQVDQHDEMLHRRALDREDAATAKRGPGRPRKLSSIGLLLARDPAAGNPIAEEGSKQVFVAATEQKKGLTVCLTVKASRHVLPLQLIYEGKPPAAQATPTPTRKQARLVCNTSSSANSSSANTSSASNNSGDNSSSEDGSANNEEWVVSKLAAGAGAGAGAGCKKSPVGVDGQARAATGVAGRTRSAAGVAGRTESAAGVFASAKAAAWVTARARKFECSEENAEICRHCKQPQEHHDFMGEVQCPN
ncbi:hypothetical protein QJQ45_011457 [Haematococcus lacustris]|nr:hypothetical protein QJQ45_011457 [Haematococcus lacustris]